MALDGGGNIYVADGGSSSIKQMPPGCASSSCVITVSSTFAEYLALDGSGNLYISSPYTYGGGPTEELPFATPPSLTFADTIEGSQSSDSPQTVTLRNIGNGPLSFPAPATGENPSVSANFALDASTTCPEVLSSSSPGTLAPGASCALAIDFVPTTTGVLTGSATLTDNSGNASYAMQSISMSGYGQPLTTIRPTVTVTPAQYVLTTTYTLPVTITVSGGSGNPTPTGTVTLSAGSEYSVTEHLSGGSTAFGILAGWLPAGNYILSATYTPDTNSRSIYTGATGSSASVTVMQAIGTCANPNPNPNPNPAVFANPGDFNGDCKSDLLWQNSSTGQLYVWLMNGAAYSSAASPGTVSPSSGWVIKGVGDFDGDGKSDILWQNSSTGQLYIWLMNGTTYSAAASPGTVSPSSGWVIEGIGDFNGDGTSDILWQNSSTGQLYTWFMNGASITTQQSPGTASPPWQVADVGDYNGDGKSDIVLWNSSTGQVEIWFNGVSIAGRSAGSAATVWQIVPYAP